MVNGAGKMATAAAEAIVRSEEFELMPFAFTGNNAPSNRDILGVNVRSIRLEDRADFLRSEAGRSSFLTSDFTHPDVVNLNADTYCNNNLHFVMGTTGGDRDALEERVRNSAISAVIAPNMAKQVVGLQSVIKAFSEVYRGCWVKEDSGLYIRESHQGVDVPNDFEGKADTSGTAKAMVEYFQKLGIPYGVKDIDAKIRDIEDQRLLGIPESALQGHGWHRYKLHSFNPENQELLNALYEGVSRFLGGSNVFDSYHGDYSKVSREAEVGNAVVSLDESVLFRVEQRKGEVKIDHNISGRNAYAEGNLDALRCLNKNVKFGAEGEVYSMINVAEGK